jgi:hypothetical protein
MTRTDANKQIAAEFITALFTNGDLTAVDRYLDAGFVNHDPPFPGAPDGPEGMRKAAEIFRRAFPDWRSGVQQLIATATRRRDGPLTPGPTDMRHMTAARHACQASRHKNCSSPEPR